VRTGRIAARPTGWPVRQATNRGVLDLIVPAGLLEQLGGGTPPDGPEPEALAAWLPVIADLAARAGDTEHDCDPARRFPTEALRRDVEVRTPTCVGLGCRRAAHGSEIDHNLDHAYGGPTALANLAPACGHDHDLKTKGGWRLDRVDPTTLRWTTRLGRCHTVRINPLVEQLPAPGGYPNRIWPPLPEDPELDHAGRPWADSDPWIEHDREPMSEPEPEAPPTPVPAPSEDEPCPF
jgi:hypothetical protein